MPVRSRLVPLAMLASIVFGCAHPPAAAGVPPESPARPTPASSLAPDARALGQRLLASMRERLATSAGFDTEMTSRAEGTWDDGEDRGVRRTNRNRAKLQWTRPHRLHGEMLEAPFALMVGGTLDTADGQHLTLRPKGLLSVVALTVSATDVKLRSSRNHTFRDSHPAAQLARLTGPAAAWTVLASAGGTVRIAVAGVRRLDAAIEREELVVAEGSLALQSLSMFAGGRAVVHNTYAAFRWR